MKKGTGESRALTMGNQAVNEGETRLVGLDKKHVFYCIKKVFV